ncbi:MAG: DUF6436 domain-containing protein [Cellvibrionaceae bacterium]
MISSGNTPVKLKSTALALTIIGLWITIVASGFWWYELRLIRPFLDNLALFDGQQLDENYRPNSNSITLMHFGDPTCPCNQFNQPHLEQLKNYYQPKGVLFVAWQQGSEIPPTAGFDRVYQAPNLPFVPVTPAVAIWSHDGKLSYFGPYSSGLLCSLGEGFAETILDQLQAGLSPQVINTTGVGCFCPTRSQTT